MSPGPRWPFEVRIVTGGGDVGGAAAAGPAPAPAAAPAVEIVTAAARIVRRHRRDGFSEGRIGREWDTVCLAFSFGGVRARRLAGHPVPSFVAARAGWGVA